MTRAEDRPGAVASSRRRGPRVEFGSGTGGADGVVHGARTVVVHPALPSAARTDLGRDAQARLAEAVGLAEAIALDVQASEVVKLRTPRVATLLGSGQIERLASLVAAHGAELVVVDGALTPIQQRNLEKALGAKVIDRTGLILEIFGERANTREGVLQVELAHLSYQASRLVRSWTHLERQRGGFGFLGGPGETQIEADRRLIRDRIARLGEELDDVRRTRGLHRARRQQAPYPVVALVGYTNAGKSTLFNRLTGADVMAQNLLFATLDPTMRAIDLPGIEKAILSDTVGFISALPTQLIAAFRATLEEVLEADIIVHVRDSAHPESDAQAEDVRQVLRDLGVIEGEGEGGPPVIEALNKIDLLHPDRRTGLEAEAQARDDVVLLSAQTGEGVETLRRAIAGRLTAAQRVHRFRIAAADGARLAWLHRHGSVVAVSPRPDGGSDVQVRLSEAMKARFDGL